MPEADLFCDKGAPKTARFRAGPPLICWLRTLLKLLIAGSFMTDVCTVVWKCALDTKYYHVDDATEICPTGFLDPGGWVDDTAVSVEAVGKPPSWTHAIDNHFYPDHILAGWSVARLWRYWWGFLAVDVVATLGLVLMPWRRSVKRFMRIARVHDELAGFVYAPLAILAFISLPYVFDFLMVFYCLSALRR